MKLLYIITGLAQGGAERVVCDLADAMYARGHEVKIAYLTGDILTHPNHKEIELIKVNLNSFIALPKTYLKLSRIIKKYCPDVVHAHMVHANILMRLVRLSTPMNKLICTAHNSNEGGKLRMLAYRVTHKLADLTTNVSREAVIAFEDMKAVPSNEMITIYNGIDLEKFSYSSSARMELNLELNIDNSYKVILAVGRFSEQKDYPNLLKAVHLLKAEAKFLFKLVIVGDGDLRILIESMIDRLGLKNEVILLGRRNDIPSLMSAADLFILPSKYEGFGLVVAEAMACECLVVATDCGGVAEVLNDSDFLIPKCNHKMLKNKIQYCISLTTNEQYRITQKNLRYVKDNFSLEDIVNQWIVLYDKR